MCNFTVPFISSICFIHPQVLRGGNGGVSNESPQSEMVTICDDEVIVEHGFDSPADEVTVPLFLYFASEDPIQTQRETQQRLAVLTVTLPNDNLIRVFN